VRDPDGHILGIVYIVHFDRKLHHAQHSINRTADLDVRLTVHANGRGSRLIAAVRDAGIGFQVVRRFHGTRIDERRIKAQRNGPRWCQLCNRNPSTPTWGMKEIIE